MTTKTKAAAKAPATKAAAPKAAPKATATKALATAKASAATKSAKAAKVETITIRHLGDALSESYGLSKKQANSMLSDAIDMMTTHLKKGARVRINGLGILQVKKRAPRVGRNPATGEQIKIKASKKVAFRAAKELKESI